MQYWKPWTEPAQKENETMLSLLLPLNLVCEAKISAIWSCPILTGSFVQSPLCKARRASRTHFLSAKKWDLLLLTTCIFVRKQNANTCLSVWTLHMARWNQSIQRSIGMSRVQGKSANSCASRPAFSSGNRCDKTAICRCVSRYHFSFLGHSDRESLGHYIRLDIENLRECALSFEDGDLLWAELTSTEADWQVK